MLTSGPAGVGWSWAAFEDTGFDCGGDVETGGRVAAVIAAREGSAGVTVEVARFGVRAGEAERRVLGAAGADAVPAVPLEGSGAVRCTQEATEEITGLPLPEGGSVTRSIRITIIACKIKEQTTERPRRSSGRRRRPTLRLKGE